MEQIWEKIDTYVRLSAESKAAWAKIIRKKTYQKNEFFLMEGQVPKSVAFVIEGLFAQYFSNERGDTVIKKFFPEESFVASTTALIQQAESPSAIKALENSTVLEYNFNSFKLLTQEYADIAAFYIRYMEIHWVVEKEPLEVSFRYDTAKARYLSFLKSYPALEHRLKQHEIAAFLGITPTQLSRIRAEL